MAQAPTVEEPGRRVEARPLRRRRGRAPLPVEFYRSAVGKKWVMALTGLALLGFVLVHLIGNLKLYLSKEEMNLYGEALRDLGGHLVPRTSLLWILRVGLVGAFALHIHAAYSLTVLNRRARPDAYRSRRDYAAATFASRSMRWTGTIVALYLLFHLADLTWGSANSEFVRGDPYNNLVYSLQRPVVAIAYAVANVALAIHILHGTWSLFQSLGWNNPRFNPWRLRVAQGFAGVILLGNLSFPLLVQVGAVDLECPRDEIEAVGLPYDPELSCEDYDEIAALVESGELVPGPEPEETAE